MRWSLAVTEDNRPVAVIEEDILNGVPQEEWRSTAKRILAERFPDGIIVSGEIIKVNRTTRNEFTKSDYTERLRKRQPDVFADKMRLAASLDDFVIASTDRLRDGTVAHERNDNFVDFSHGNVLLQVCRNQYTADVVIGYTAQGEAVLYDVVKIKHSEFKTKSSGNKGHRQSEDALSSINVSTAGDSIAQGEETVNASDEDSRLSLSSAADEKRMCGLRKITPSCVRR